jgi:hypothetical protein
MKSLHSWLLRFLLVGAIALLMPTAPAHAATTTWQDLPDNLFDRMVCFDGGNADVNLGHGWKCLSMKTSTKLTNYVLPDNRISSTKWCSDDGWFYNTSDHRLQRTDLIIRLHRLQIASSFADADACGRYKSTQRNRYTPHRQ